MRRLNRDEDRWHELIELIPLMRRVSLLSQLDHEGLTEVERRACEDDDRELRSAVREERQRRHEEVASLCAGLFGWHSERCAAERHQGSGSRHQEGRTNDAERKNSPAVRRTRKEVGHG